MDPRSAILVVDDEAIIVMSLKRELLGRYGRDFMLETAMSAVEAEGIIDELSSEGVKIILIISDWLMPGVKGDEFLERVQARHPDVRCILLSGHADDDEVRKLRERVRLDAFLRKPWSKAELLDAVDACVAAEDASRGDAGIE